MRTALRTHSFSASSAGIATVEPGSVIVCCARPAFGLANALSTHGGTLRSPLSPMRSPWAGSSVDVVGVGGAGAGGFGAGVWHATAAASAPGPETLRMLASKSCTSSKIAE